MWSKRGTILPSWSMWSSEYMELIPNEKLFWPMASEEGRDLVSDSPDFDSSPGEDRWEARVVGGELTVGRWSEPMQESLSCLTDMSVSQLDSSGPWLSSRREEPFLE